MENEPGFHVRMIDGRYEGESIVGERLVAHSAKGRANPRPRFKRRTWDTLRVVLSCERERLPAAIKLEFERFGVRLPVPLLFFHRNVDKK